MRFFQENDGAKFLSRIWGPTCDDVDRVTAQCRLPALEEGDWLVFENTGAYSLVLASDFNGFPRPTVHYWGSAASWSVHIFARYCSFTVGQSVNTQAKNWPIKQRHSRRALFIGCPHRCCDLIGSRVI